MNPLNLFDKTTTLLNKSLDLRSANQRVIASNIANAETPGYAPATLDFEEDLKNAINGKGPLLSVTNEKHIPIGAHNVEDVNGKIIRTPDNTGIGDENGVSVDAEMIALSENQIMYETGAKLLRKKLAILKYVISGGQ